MKKTKEKAERRIRVDQTKDGRPGAFKRDAGWPAAQYCLTLRVHGPLRDRGGSGGRVRRLGRIHQSPRFREPLRERAGLGLWRRRAEWRGGYLQQSAKGAQ